MPLATSYDETTLATWLVLRVGLIGTVLTWTPLHPQVVEAVADTERLLGVSEITADLDARRVELSGSVAIWQRAVDNLAALYDQDVQTETFKRSQLMKQATERLAEAREAWIAYGTGTGLPGTGGTGGGLQVTFAPRRYLADPYIYLPEDVRTVPP